jgi:hypothetical protein
MAEIPMETFTKELDREEIGSLVVDGLRYRHEWPKDQTAHVHFNTNVKNTSAGRVKDVVITATVSPLYSEDELMK